MNQKHTKCFVVSHKRCDTWHTLDLQFKPRTLSNVIYYEQLNIYLKKFN